MSMFGKGKKKKARVRKHLILAYDWKGKKFLGYKAVNRIIMECAVECMWTALHIAILAV